MAAFGLQVSYLLPIGLLCCRRIRIIPGDQLAFGPWSMGPFGLPVNIVSILFLSFTCIFLVFPPYQPFTAANMNYASLVFGAVYIFSGLYWLWKGQKVYNGPVLPDDLLSR